jgi:MFS family permease
MFQTLAASLEVMLLGRFISGIAMSIMSVGVSMYNTEMAPSSIRGTIAGRQQLVVATGSAVAYWLNYYMRNVDERYQAVVPLGCKWYRLCCCLQGCCGYLIRPDGW